MEGAIGNLVATLTRQVQKNAKQDLKIAELTQQNNENNKFIGQLIRRNEQLIMWFDQLREDFKRSRKQLYAYGDLKKKTDELFNYYVCAEEDYEREKIENGFLKYRLEELEKSSKPEGEVNSDSESELTSDSEPEVKKSYAKVVTQQQSKHLTPSTPKVDDFMTNLSENSTTEEEKSSLIPFHEIDPEIKKQICLYCRRNNKCQPCYKDGLSKWTLCFYYGGGRCNKGSKCNHVHIRKINGFHMIESDSVKKVRDNMEEY